MPKTVKSKEKRNVSFVWRSIRDIHQLSPHLLTFMTASAVSTSIFPFVNVYFTAEIIDVLTNDSSNTRHLLFLVSVALLLNFAFYFIRNAVSYQYGIRRFTLVGREIARVNEKIFSMDYALLENPDVYEKIRRYDDDRKQHGISSWRLQWSLTSVISGSITLLIAIIMLWEFFGAIFKKTGDSFIETPWLAIVVLAVIAVGAGIVGGLNVISQKKYYQYNDAFLKIDKEFNFYSDMLSNYRNGQEIRAYHEQDLIKHYACDQMMTKGVSLLKKMSMNTAFSGSIIAIISAVLACGVYILIGSKGLLGVFGVGSVVRFSGAFLQIVQGVINLATSLGQMKVMRESLKYYYDVLDIQPVQKNGTRPIDFDPDTARIEFRDVSFKYPGAENYALKNVSIVLEPGQRYAVVGKNGSGKTTFIKLLCRFYDVEEGEIRINGVDIREYDIASYREIFSVVFQDFEIFSFTVGQDTAVAETYESGRLWNSLESAGLKERIECLPKRVETYVTRDLSEEGVDFSGGEQQKLTLARALYKNSPIIILDEPAAALDPIAEYDMYTRFNGFVGNKTAVYISHRLSSCRFCANIIVFDLGRIVQCGSHDALLHNEKGKYYQLWHAQSQYYAE